MSLADHDADCTCIGCKARSIQVTPSASPAQRRHGVPRDKSGSNAWERGTVVRNGRQVLKADGTPLTRKEFANRRSHYEGQFRQLAAEQAANTVRA